MAAENFSQRIREIYRIVVGATIGFLPFVMYFLVREAHIGPLAAGVLWLLTFSVIISEWWSIEDNTIHYPINNTFLTILSMMYLIVLTMLPVSLILGLDEANILRPYIISIVGLDKYNNLQPYVIVFVALCLVDIPIQFIYHKNIDDESDKKYFIGNIVFDVVLIFIYVVLFFAVGSWGLSNIWSAVLLIGVYFVESYVDWRVVPYLFPRFL